MGGRTDTLVAPLVKTATTCPGGFSPEKPYFGTDTGIFLGKVIKIFDFGIGVG
jgi:hypothetical protein